MVNYKHENVPLLGSELPNLTIALLKNLAF